MRLKLTGTAGLGLAGWLALTSTSAAQEKTQTVPQRVESNHLYSTARETVLKGTVVEFTPNSTVAPMGAHVSLQTGSGVVDVHLGNARVLTANHLSLQAGDAVQITGENVVFGPSSVFAARMIQKGAQTVIVRTRAGVPVATSLHAANTNAQGGTIR
jgi:hypothetical protein